MAETKPGTTGVPPPTKPQPVIAEQPLPDANEEIATNTPSSTQVTASNDRSVANIHTGDKIECDPTLVSTPDGASSSALDIPTTGFQANAVPIPDANPLGSTDSPLTANKTEPTPGTVPAEGSSVDGNLTTLPSSSQRGEYSRSHR